MAASSSSGAFALRFLSPSPDGGPGVDDPTLRSASTHLAIPREAVRPIQRAVQRLEGRRPAPSRVEAVLPSGDPVPVCLRPWRHNHRDHRPAVHRCFVRRQRRRFRMHRRRRS